MLGQICSGRGTLLRGPHLEQGLDAAAIGEGGDHLRQIGRQIVPAALLRVLTTSYRKPPLRRSRQGLHPRVAEVRADFAVLPG